MAEARCSTVNRTRDCLELIFYFPVHSGPGKIEVDSVCLKLRGPHQHQALLMGAKVAANSSVSCSTSLNMPPDFCLHLFSNQKKKFTLRNQLLMKG